MRSSPARQRALMAGGVARGHGEPAGIRTLDLLIKSQLLCRLSYGLARTIGTGPPPVNPGGAAAGRR